MEIEYSPSHHSPTNAVHLLSPSHAHTGLEAFASIRQLRRSLSRSPSKPARFLLRTCSTSPTTAHSPSLLGRAGDYTADIANRTRSSSKRPAPARASGRRASPNSPIRHVLGDNSNQASFSPRSTRRTSADYEQENMDCQEDAESNPAESKCDGSTRLDRSRSRPDPLLQPVFREHAPPKSSPLKRSDGVMNLDAAATTSPRVKRRSIQGSVLNDFNIFDQGLDGHSSPGQDGGARLPEPSYSVPHPAVNPSSPHRRPFSLRRSTLQQRNVPGRTRLFGDVLVDGHSSTALTRARSRMSLDGALIAQSTVADVASRRNSADMNPPVTFHPPGQRLYQSAPKPHPLSHALTPSSSTSSMADEPHMLQPTLPQQTPQLPAIFSRSLPIGPVKPSPAGDSSQESYATPAGYKMARPLPQAFMSTGLISKRNRNVDASLVFGAGPMPDTPSKKAHSHITPLPRGVGSFNIIQPQDFDSPNTPFHCRVTDYSPETYRTSNIFGVAPVDHNRRSSFASIHDDDQGISPSRLPESQSSVDDLPPTPTKSAGSGARPQSKGKSNSLRSSLFGRRTSLGPDTFVPPAASEALSPEKANLVSHEGVSSLSAETTTPALQISPNKRSPHTPSDTLPDTDPTKLSVSAERTSTLFPSNSFPPATPTGPRDQPFRSTLGIGQSLAGSGYFANDVDTALTSRFSNVVSFGVGEFSQVYKVEGALQAPLNSPATACHMLWAVKKSRKPYIGIKDRQRKMQEVQLLQQLRGHEHIIELVDSWEAKDHLYIQTQFCENGNLKDFLSQAGFKGRLDDFRIWKILLELSQGVKSIHDAHIIHLDIKPANVFIDWEGVLKIGDFGLASPWPAPSGIDGEGDREYIGPEVLSGRFDKPSDIFSLGMVMLEIAGNIVLPDNGKSWQRLRAGDMSDLPSLTWSSDSSLPRNESGEPIAGMVSNSSLCFSQPGDDDLAFLRNTATADLGRSELVTPPNFMIDARDPEALDMIVQWMICPDPDKRPVVDQLLAAGGVQWVQRRRRAGATIYEGNWGPADAVLDHEQDVEMVDI